MNEKLTFVNSKDIHFLSLSFLFKCCHVSNEPVPTVIPFRDFPTCFSFPKSHRHLSEWSRYIIEVLNCRMLHSVLLFTTDKKKKERGTQKWRHRLGEDNGVEVTHLVYEIRASGRKELTISKEMNKRMTVKPTL